MTHNLNLILDNDISEISRLADDFCAWGKKVGAPANVIEEFGVALDDLATNIILYAFPGGGHHKISIDLRADEKNLKGVITDDGVAFDPLNQKSPAVNASIQERKVGGLGIVIAQSMLDDIRYERRGNKNVLSLTKKI